jgi:hypothetical protein
MIKKIVTILLFCCFIPISGADKLNPPPNSLIYKQNVIQQVKSGWPDIPFPVYIPAQIEQETCISYKHKKCWNPKAELKTSREWGVGLNQMTIAYNKDGTERFNYFKELKRSKEFVNWDWEDRYNPDFQILAIILSMKKNWYSITFSDIPPYERYAMALNIYNGGYGGFIRDMNLCLSNKPRCDSKRWYGNIEKFSTKSKKPQPEYGARSFYEISREYPVNVQTIMYKHYVDWFTP